MAKRPLPLNLITVFEAVALERNVTRAAQRLNMSQSAVSHSLRRLRDLIGDELFIRKSRGVEPTTRAIELAGTIAPLLAQLRASLDPADFDPASSEHSFRLFLSDYAAPLFFSELTSSMIESGPNLGLNVTVGSIPQGLDGLLRNNVDFLIAASGDPGSPFESILLIEDEGAEIVMAPDNPLRRGKLTLERYAAARHIYVPIDGAGRIGGMIDQALANAGLVRNLAVKMTQFSSVPPLIARTDFVMLAPTRMAAFLRARHGLHTVPLPLNLPLLETRLIWHPSFATRRADEWFRSFVTEVSRALPRC